MIKHIVMWRLKDEARGAGKSANAERMKEMLDALQGRIPGLLRIEAGLAINGGDAAADVVLYSEFEDREALAAYQAHPEHEAVKAFIGEVTEARWVVDYEG